MSQTTLHFLEPKAKSIWLWKKINHNVLFSSIIPAHFVRYMDYFIFILSAIHILLYIPKLKLIPLETRFLWHETSNPCLFTNTKQALLRQVPELQCVTAIPAVLYFKSCDVCYIDPSTVGLYIYIFQNFSSSSIGG